MLPTHKLAIRGTLTLRIAHMLQGNVDSDVLHRECPYGHAWWGLVSMLLFTHACQLYARQQRNAS